MRSRLQLTTGSKEAVLLPRDAAFLASRYLATSPLPQVRLK